MLGIGSQEFILIITTIAFFIIPIIALWKIITKAGFSGWLVILAFIPLINIALFLFIAFAKWPIEKELEKKK